MDPNNRLQGSLGEFSLADIVQLVSMGAKSGCLTLWNCAKKPEGKLYFEYGHVVHASSNGTEGEGAARQLLGLSNGAFEFIPGERSDRKTTMVSGCELLMKVAQFEDEEAFLDQGGQLVLEIEDNLEADLERIREELVSLVRTSLGRKAGPPIEALQAADPTMEGFLNACDRIRSYVAMFVDEGLSAELDGKMRSLVHL